MTRGSALFLMGAPGVGKSTVAGLVSRRMGGLSVRSGEMLRQVAAHTSDALLRETIAYSLKTSSPVAPDIYLRAVREVLGHGKVMSMVFDGYPKSVEQSAIIPDLLVSAGIHGARVAGFVLAASAEAVISRLGSRMICVRCGSDRDGSGACCAEPEYVVRADDDSAQLEARTHLFQRLQADVGRAFAAHWPMHQIDAERNVESVAAEILGLVDLT
jgi:adenylate kinase family enzyme